MCGANRVDVEGAVMRRENLAAIAGLSAVTGYGGIDPMRVSHHDATLNAVYPHHPDRIHHIQEQKGRWASDVDEQDSLVKYHILVYAARVGGHNGRIVQSCYYRTNGRSR